ncbi:PRD domain-containing protein [Clostridium paraputrificum]|uniref:PRD domain-containing protein n=1 Tax=Clostridium paraputrificum TaxID=29363 RepID=UPI000DCFBE4A|nr:PRD domain-containing protein [Clostridium paraputrificum]
MILSNDEIVTKVFNNNIILVNSEDHEKILFAKGIGFGKKPGYVIPKGIKVDKIFTIADSDNIENLNTMIEKVDNDFFVVCEEAIYEISEKINQELNESIHIGLIDHLSFAIKRLKNNEEIENPFLVEIETLYSKEYMLADMVAKKVGAYCNVDIPDGEIAFIALHIHSAINNGKISNTLKNSYLGSTIVEHVEDRLNIEIDRKSLDYARFLTHIKFAIQRIMENIHINNELTNIIKSSYKESFSIAEEVAEIIEDELGIKVMEDEVTFLTIHIERFRMSIR